MMNEFESLVLLNMIPSLGCVSIKRLLEKCGSAHRIFRESEYNLSQIEGITVRKISAIKKSKSTIDLHAELDLARKKDIDIVTIMDSRYPESLKDIYDSPPVLYIKGELLDCDYNAIAIVGSRRASFYGISAASRLSSQLANLGITIVSGLARGIDTASHRGALQVKGRNIAVLGSGLLKIYPPRK